MKAISSVTLKTTIAAAAWLGVLIPPIARAQIYVSSTTNGAVAEFTTSGQMINASLITGLIHPVAMTFLGGNLFVADLLNPNATASSSQVREYSAVDGSVVNSSLLTLPYRVTTLATNAGQILLSENEFANTENGYVFSYSTAGQPGSMAFGSPYPASGFAVLGSTVALGQPQVGLTGQVSTYGLTGTAIATPLVGSLPSGTITLASDGQKFYIADSSAGTVGTYSVNGTPINANLVSNLSDPVSIVIDGQALFVLTGNGAISEYSTSGQLINAQLVTGIIGASAFTVGGPVVQNEPKSVQVADGDCASLFVGATGQGALSYQWLQNGSTVVGATDPYLFLWSVSNVNTGSYTCEITDGNGITTSTTAAIIAVVSVSPGPIINLSARANCGQGSAQATAGFTVASQVGPGASLPLLVRAVGTTLGNFGVQGVLPDPSLTLYQTTSGAPTSLETNSGWNIASNTPSAIEAAANATGAFPLPIGSADAAVLRAFPPGTYTENISGISDDQGVILAELYDASSPPGSSLAHLVNVSARANVTSGSGALVAGFVVSGSTARTFLIRATGPGLSVAPFNVPGILPHPLLSLYAINSGGSDTLLLTNPILERRSGPIANRSSSLCVFPNKWRCRTFNFVTARIIYRERDTERW